MCICIYFHRYHLCCCDFLKKCYSKCWSLKGLAVTLRTNNKSHIHVVSKREKANKGPRLDGVASPQGDSGFSVCVQFEAVWHDVVTALKVFASASCRRVVIGSRLKHTLHSDISFLFFLSEGWTENHFFCLLNLNSALLLLQFSRWMETIFAQVQEEETSCSIFYFFFPQTCFVLTMLLTTAKSVFHFSGSIFQFTTSRLCLFLQLFHQTVKKVKRFI